MKARVIKIDESVIYNGNIYGCDDEFEVTDSIGKSLIERGLVADVSNAPSFQKDDEKNDETAGEIKEGTEIRDDIDEMEFQDLRSYAKELGLSAGGNKEELIARIKEHLAQFTEVQTADDADDETADDDSNDDSNEGSDETPDTSMPE